MAEALAGDRLGGPYDRRVSGDRTQERVVVIMGAWKFGNFEAIGSGVEFATLVDRLDRFSGVLLRHACREEDLVTDYLIFDLPWNNTPEHASTRKFKVERWEPLTLSPSFVCSRCGLNGWVRDGQWITDVEKKLEALYAVPVFLLFDGQKVPVGAFQVDPNSRSLETEQRSLAALLRMYADKINDSLSGRN